MLDLTNILQTECNFNRFGPLFAEYNLNFAPDVASTDRKLMFSVFIREIRAFLQMCHVLEDYCYLWAQNGSSPVGLTNSHNAEETIHCQLVIMTISPNDIFAPNASASPSVASQLAPIDSVQALPNAIVAATTTTTAVAAAITIAPAATANADAPSLRRATPSAAAAAAANDDSMFAYPTAPETGLESLASKRNNGAAAKPASKKGSAEKQRRAAKGTEVYIFVQLSTGKLFYLSQFVNLCNNLVRQNIEEIHAKKKKNQNHLAPPNTNKNMNTTANSNPNSNSNAHMVMNMNMNMGTNRDKGQYPNNHNSNDNNNNNNNGNANMSVHEVDDSMEEIILSRKSQERRQKTSAASIQSSKAVHAFDLDEEWLIEHRPHRVAEAKEQHHDSDNDVAVDMQTPRGFLPTQVKSSPKKKQLTVPDSVNMTQRGHSQRANHLSNPDNFLQRNDADQSFAKPKPKSITTAKPNETLVIEEDDDDLFQNDAKKKFCIVYRKCHRQMELDDALVGRKTTAKRTHIPNARQDQDHVAAQQYRNQMDRASHARNAYPKPPYRYTKDDVDDTLELILPETDPELYGNFEDDRNVTRTTDRSYHEVVDFMHRRPSNPLLENSQRSQLTPTQKVDQIADRIRNRNQGGAAKRSLHQDRNQSEQQQYENDYQQQMNRARKAPRRDYQQNTTNRTTPARTDQFSIPGNSSLSSCCSQILFGPLFLVVVVSKSIFLKKTKSFSTFQLVLMCSHQICPHFQKVFTYYLFQIQPFYFKRYFIDSKLYLLAFQRT
ncbi:hypothetical protein RFI_26984 [Reticulomyxa filosa]|uniref:Uncharacterized protein n=1 Tax=Reticulomyxa filosa TaxID=46433 RepID=X6MAB4_RETFI|nr:hypothetical protein RFI_26984 [Reticulomyxa filosa]|eukprot:ETO10392.1 hypothetical protein RFI_26984 [Reticulomyxa filosa]